MRTAFFRQFLRDVRAQKLRLTLTLFGIVWGTVSVALLLAFGEGLRANVLKEIRGLGENIVIGWPMRTSKPWQGLPRGRQIRVTEEDMDLLAAEIPEISSISAEFSTSSVRFRAGRNVIVPQLTGVEPAFGEMRNLIPEADGRFTNDLDRQRRRRCIFLGDELRTDLFGAESAVGRYVYLNNVPFLVVGVMREKRQMGMYGGPDEDHAAIPLSTFQALFGDPYLDDMVVKPRDPSRAEHVKRRINEVLGAKYRFDPEDSRAVYVWDTIENARTFLKVMFGIEVFLGIIGGLTLLIGGIGVANIMYAAVKQRTQAIGVQMALGAFRADVMGPIVLEAVAITCVGGAAGIAAGWGIVQGLGFVQGHVESQAMEFIGTPTFSLPIAGVTVLILGMTGLLAGYFPSRRAARVQPAEALRHE
ncbi:MAG: ABC transporter permease [Candidatus Eisenbacteria bacterium]|nr:ABC transporter permease [Candidatus Eisenbacteria bacterium]